MKQQKMMHDSRLTTHEPVDLPKNKILFADRLTTHPKPNTANRWFITGKTAL
jgi:hypothetical protein